MFTFRRVDYLPENDQPLPKTLIPFLWHFIRQMKAQLFAITAVMLVSHSLDNLYALYIKFMTDGLVNLEPGQNAWVELALPMGLLVLTNFLIQPGLSQLGQWMMGKTRPVFINMMRRQLALYMHGHNYNYFQNDFAGRLASKVVETPQAAADAVFTVITTLLYGFTTLAIAIAYFASAHWVFAVTAVVWVCFYGIVIKIHLPRVTSISKETSDQRSIVRGRYVDTLTNIFTVKLFARRKHEDAYLLEALTDTSDMGTQMIEATRILYFWIEVSSVMLLAAGFGLCIYGWEQDWLTVGDIGMVMIAIIRVMNVSWWFSDVFSAFSENIGQVQEGMEAITMAHETTDKPDAKRIKITKGHIEFKNVAFAYESQAVFDGFNLEIMPGQKIGLIGPSGAGKSSLINMLLRFYDIQSGAILIDGQTIAHIQQDSLREQIAVIPQMPDLLHRSIRDNIRYGKLNASDAEIIDAARKAHAYEFIQMLEDQHGNKGLDALVGERGVKLSGGQRQRIAIARAILKDAPILILDEATSALDSESERAIQASLKDLMAGKTVIAIAHRLSTIAHLERLIVMDAGKIIEDGSHQALLEKGGAYAKFWAMQSSEFAPS